MASDLILVRSDLGDGGWSLHMPGSSDEEIVEGDGFLLSGTSEWDDDSQSWGRPNVADYMKAELILEQKERAR